MTNKKLLEIIYKRFGNGKKDYEKYIQEATKAILELKPDFDMQLDVEVLYDDLFDTPRFAEFFKNYPMNDDGIMELEHEQILEDIENEIERVRV